MLNYIKYSSEENITCNSLVCGFVCMIVGLWACVFLWVYVIVGVRVDVFVCMFFVFVSVATLVQVFALCADTWPVALLYLCESMCIYL